MRPGLILEADPRGVAAASSAIRSGGVVVYPTETVYGIGADPFCPAAVQRVFAIKGRDAAKGLILLISGRGDLTRLVADVPDAAARLMATFWPGPLTLVFPAGPDAPTGLVAKAGTVAVRHSDNPVCEGLVKAVGGPITSTSANRSGGPPATSAQQAAEVLGCDVDLILDGGPVADPRPSTLVDVSGARWAILREGPISASEVGSALA